MAAHPCGPVAQSVRALRLHRRCRRFESGRAHHRLRDYHMSLLEKADKLWMCTSESPRSPERELLAEGIVIIHEIFGAVKDAECLCLPVAH